MKFMLSLLLIAGLSFIVCLYLPWWTIAIVALLVNVLVSQKPFPAFLSAFAAIFVLWFLISSAISIGNHHILAHRMSQVILKSDSPYALVAVTAIIGGLVAGFAGLAGSYAWKPK